MNSKKIDLVVSDVQKEAEPLIRQANLIEVTNNNQYVFADGYVKKIIEFRKKVKSLIDPYVDDAYNLHKSYVARRKEQMEPMEIVEKVIKNKMLVYQQECERKQREEQARAEAKARAEAEARAREAAKDMPEEEAKEFIEEAKENAPVIIAPKQEVKLNGSHVKKSFDFEIIDELKINRSYLKVDESAIRAFVKSKGKLAERIIGGIRVFEKSTMVVKR